MMQILDRKVEFSTPWFELVAKRVTGEATPYYALRMADYVSVLPITPNNEVVLVRQFRPAVERHTIELPSGLKEKNETPEACARRELAEECGLQAAEMELLGELLSDAGRHQNRLWCFLARGACPLPAPHTPEPGIECLLVPRQKLGELICNGEFDHAPNLAVLMLAVARHGPEFLGGPSPMRHEDRK